MSGRAERHGGEMSLRRNFPAMQAGTCCNAWSWCYLLTLALEVASYSSAVYQSAGHRDYITIRLFFFVLLSSRDSRVEPVAGTVARLVLFFFRVFRI